MNQIYLGQRYIRNYTASLEYFDKPIKELNFSDAALLAALPKAQVNTILTDTQIQGYLENLVLQNLMENKFITKEEFEVLKKSKLNLKEEKLKSLTKPTPIQKRCEGQ